MYRSTTGIRTSRGHRATPQRNRSPDQLMSGTARGTDEPLGYCTVQLVRSGPRNGMSHPLGLNDSACRQSVILFSAERFFPFHLFATMV